MKEVTKTVPFSTRVRKEQMRRERNRNVGRSEKHVTAARRRISDVVRWSSLGGGSSPPLFIWEIFFLKIDWFGGLDLEMQIGKHTEERREGAEFFIGIGIVREREMVWQKAGVERIVDVVRNCGM
uniref:Uncharacterized protein n=1 Tax=Opuntia streptacantha TaxID=393608 RepID=A0A7C8YPV3_OPUST